jgi:hypothetical protein
MKNIIYLIIGVIIGSVIFGVLSFALSQEAIVNFTDDSVPVLNNIIRDLRFEITDIKARLDAHSI